MTQDHFNYDQLMLDAHRGVVREVLLRVEQTGLPGEHHFFIIFSTQHKGTRISDRLRAQYPSEMTIVLQHQYSNLNVLDSHFEIQLSFNRIPELLVIPFAAITGFVDPSVPFGLQLAGDPAAGLENSIGMLVPGMPKAASKTGDEADTLELEDDYDDYDAGLEIAESDDTSVPSIFSSKLATSKDSREKVGLYSVENNALEDEEEERENANIVQLDAFRKKSK